MGQAFAEFIADRLECPVAAVIRPKLSSRLAHAGIPADLAKRSEAVLESLVDQRYGKAACSTGIDPVSAVKLVEDLEASFVHLEAAL